MKFITTKKSDVKKDVDVYTFQLGKQELGILYDVLTDIYTRTPRTLFTQPLTSRVNAMREEIRKTFIREKIKWPVRRSEYKLEEGEIF